MGENLKSFLFLFTVLPGMLPYSVEPSIIIVIIFYATCGQRKQAVSITLTFHHLHDDIDCVFFLMETKATQVHIIQMLIVSIFRKPRTH